MLETLRFCTKKRGAIGSPNRSPEEISKKSPKKSRNPRKVCSPKKSPRNKRLGSIEEYLFKCLESSQRRKLNFDDYNII